MKNNTRLRAPFPWFGGKRRVAPEVWQGIGDVANFVEPFAGSLAVLLDRPTTHIHSVETVNDVDAYICNFWRAVRADPEGVAREADRPVNENDLLAMHVWLVNTGRERIAHLEADVDFYDVRVAGLWVAGICMWIGSGWCSGHGPWTSVDGLLTKGTPGQGVNRQLPHLGNPGRGVNRKRQETDLMGYMQALSDCLRRVRVCCGDWSRVVTDGALSHGQTVGIFLDPPYSEEIRDDTLYSTDRTVADLSGDVRRWAIANGDNPRYRIVLCGYEGEHDMPASWRVYAYSATRAYGQADSESANSENRHKERLWFSPACLKGGTSAGLFEAVTP